jgi:YVTN family beta-propeller protein
MANIRYFQISLCNSPKDFQYGVYVDDPTSQLNVGLIYSFSGLTGSLRSIPFGCYVIRSEKDPGGATQPNAVVVNSYIKDCELCLSTESNALSFSDCQGVFGSVTLDKNDFSPIPTPGDVYYLDFYLSGKEFEPITRITACFEFKELVISPRISGELYSASTQTGCEDCLLNQPIIYEVYECLSENVYYIPFPNNTYSDHLVSFTDLLGITTYCGIVNRIIEGEPATGELIFDYGNPIKTGVFCDDCLSTTNEKKKLINCLDGHEDIVWTSNLFTVGDATNISTGQGCYEISPDIVDPSEPVTYTELADFDPHSGCEDCLECHGVTYDFTSCSEVDVYGELLKINTGGNYAFSVVNDGTYAYVGYRDSNQVRKIDLTTNSVVSTINVGVGPRKLGLDISNNILSIPNYNSNSITFVDTSTMSPFTLSLGYPYYPKVAYFNTNDGYFYVGVENATGSDEIRMYTVPSYSSVTQVNVFPSIIEGVNDILQIGSLIYVCGTGNNYVQIFNTAYTPVGTFGIASQGTSMSYDLSNNLLYVATVSTTYTVIDLNTSSVSNYSPGLNSCCCDKEILFDGVNNKLYITDPCPNEIYEIDPSTNTMIQIYNTTDGSPNGMTIWSNTVYFTSYSSLITVGLLSQFINGSINSYEYIPNGNTFFHPVYNVCCEVTNTRPDFDGDYTFYSLLSYDNCGSCEMVSHDLFYCEECNTGVSGILVAPSGVYNINDFVKSHWGNSNFLCFQILDTWSEVNYGIPDFIFESESHLPYSTCGECELNSTLGITVINCDTLVESQVTLTLSEWITVTGFPRLVPRPTISDIYGNCFTVVNTCPVDNIYPAFELADYYLSGTQCRLLNPNRTEPPRSAGTEYFECVICCDCGATGGTVTQVSPPHPVWSDGYGTPVTQMGSVTLGGMFGLNN